MQFSVKVDGNLIENSIRTVKGTLMDAKGITVPLDNSKKIELIVDPLGSNDADHAAWLNPRLVVKKSIIPLCILFIMQIIIFIYWFCFGIKKIKAKL